MYVNPIIVKELRSRLRGGRTYVILTIFLIGMAALCYAVLRVYQSQARIGQPIISAHVGKGLFAALALAETLLVTFLTPAVTAGAISSEKEQLTYDMLVATPLRPGRILSGKLIATLSYILLLIFTAVPLGSIVLIFGGVAPSDLLAALALLLVVALAFGMVGLLCSAVARRSITATILAYSVVLALTVGSYFAVSLRFATNPGQQMGRTRIAAASPFSAMTSIVLRGAEGNGAGGVVPLPMPMMDGPGMLMSMPGLNVLSVGIVEFGPNGVSVYPIYRWTIVGYALMGLGCYWLASHLVRPRRRWRPALHDLAMLATITLVLTIGSGWLGMWPGILQRLGL